jgi:hypothetical protein
MKTATARPAAQISPSAGRLRQRQFNPIETEFLHKPSSGKQAGLS